jgi:hypothetical protein
MKALDIFKTIGAGLISAHPLGASALGIVNAFLPGDKQLPNTTTGDQAIQVVEQMSGTEKASIELANIEFNKASIQAVNETMRNEANSFDAFVRRWRPFYGYAIAISWFIQMLGFTIAFVYIAISAPNQLANTVQQFALLSGSLIGLWGIALAVLGVAVHKRSQDKQLSTGETPKGLLARVLNK